jgi:hypothetical protein
MAYDIKMYSTVNERISQDADLIVLANHYKKNKWSVYTFLAAYGHDGFENYKEELINRLYYLNLLRDRTVDRWKMKWTR